MVVDRDSGALRHGHNHPSRGLKIVAVALDGRCGSAMPLRPIIQTHEELGLWLSIELHVERLLVYPATPDSEAWPLI